MTDAVVVVEPDPRWPSMFDAEAARIRAAAGPLLVALEHTGSTAVPGLAAKPIIDMLGGVERLADADALVQRIVALGYEYVTKYEAEIPDRRYFVRRDARGARTHHRHVVPVGNWFWTQHLAFRDHLRARPDAVARYAALKLELAAKHGTDREAYTAGKGAFIGACIGSKRVQTG